MEKSYLKELIDNKKIIIIGCAGAARAGKDTFCEIFMKECFKMDIKACQFALAWHLKSDCKEFLLNKCVLDVFSTDTEEKEKFRELLVWYGNLQRVRTQGTFWTKLLETEIENWLSGLETSDDIPSYILISDIRYDVYPNDEVWWIKDHLNGKLVHISKEKLDGELQPPANSHEKENNPKLYNKADFKILWKEQKNKDNLNENPELISYVNDVLKKLEN